MNRNEEIAQLGFENIFDYSPQELSNLTNCFQELPVRLLMIKANYISEQQQLLKYLKKCYDIIDDNVNFLTSQMRRLWSRNYPSYLYTLEANLECDRMITDKGSLPSEEYLYYIGKIIDENGSLADYISACLGNEVGETVEDEKPDAEKENKQLRTEIDKLKKDFKDMDDRTSITQEELNSIFYGDNAVNGNHNNCQSDNEDLRQQLADAQKTIEEQPQTIEAQAQIIKESRVGKSIRIKKEFQSKMSQFIHLAWKKKMFEDEKGGSVTLKEVNDAFTEFLDFDFNAWSGNLSTLYKGGNWKGLENDIGEVIDTQESLQDFIKKVSEDEHKKRNP